MASAGTVKRRWGSVLLPWLCLYMAAAFTHAALTFPAIALILGLMYGGMEWLALIVAWSLFFPCFLLWELGLLGWDGPLEGPLEVMIPLNSLVWPLGAILLASGIRRLALWFVTWPCPPEDDIPSGETNPDRRAA